jgi:dihydroorotate dehydrogenase
MLIPPSRRAMKWNASSRRKCDGATAIIAAGVIVTGAGAATVIGAGAVVIGVGAAGIGAGIAAAAGTAATTGVAVTGRA